MRRPHSPTTVIFDLGGVLIDWNPRYLYRKLFGGDEAAMEAFLGNVCTPAWNEEQDGGRPFAQAVAELGARYPEFSTLIEAFDRRWDEMLAGAIEESVALMEALHVRGTPLYALTNWSAEKFPVARRRFGFLDRFEGIVVSGEVGLKKPDPRIFRLLLGTYGLEASDTLLIDDSEANVSVARDLGFQTHHFVSPAGLRADLARMELL